MTNQERLQEDLLFLQALLSISNCLPEEKQEEQEQQEGPKRRVDPLLEQDPWVQGIVAKAWSEGFVQGVEKAIAKGALNASRTILVNLTEARFPALAELVKSIAWQIEKPDMLLLLIKRVVWLGREQNAWME